MLEKRDLVISRKYQKQSEVRNLFVAQISGGNLASTIFRYEVWIGDYEEQHKRKTSGNAYAIRRVFIEALLDLQEDGWTRRNSVNYAHPQEKFFDPAQL